MWKTRGIVPFGEIGEDFPDRPVICCSNQVNREIALAFFPKNWHNPHEMWSGFMPK
jgi:hypothetical protein